MAVNVVNATLFGGNAPDRLETHGGMGVSLYGGRFNDTLVAIGGTDIALFGGDGDNTYQITGTTGNPLSVELDDIGTLGQSQDQVDGFTLGNNTIQLPGGTGLKLNLFSTG